MLAKDVLDGLNRQIQHELSAEHGYLGLSVYFDRELLNGFANHFRHQAVEEREHAMKLLDYVQDRGGTVTLGAVDAPKTEFGSVVEALKHAQAMERNNTESIHRLHELAVVSKDLATQQHLHWFIEEQVEEEKSADELVGMAEKVGPHAGAIFMLDHRVFKRLTGNE